VTLLLRAATSSRVGTRSLGKRAFAVPLCYGRSRPKPSAAATSWSFSAGLPRRLAVGLLRRLALRPDPLGEHVRTPVGDRQPQTCGRRGVGRMWPPDMRCGWLLVRSAVRDCAPDANGTIIVGSSCSLGPMIPPTSIVSMSPSAARPRSKRKALDRVLRVGPRSSQEARRRQARVCRFSAGAARLRPNGARPIPAPHAFCRRRWSAGCRCG
jgi:hypothetical protein